MSSGQSGGAKPFSIIFPPGKGGVHEFGSLDDALRWVEARRVDFLLTFSGQYSNDVLPEFRDMQNAWDEFYNFLDITNHSEMPPSLHLNVPDSLVIANSPVGRALYHVTERFGVPGIRGALHAAQMPVASLDWNDVETVAGIQEFQLEIDRLRRTDNSVVPFEIREQLKSFQDQIDQMKLQADRSYSDLSRIASLAESRSSSIDGNLRTLTLEIEGASNTLMSQVLQAESRLAIAEERTQQILNENAQSATRILDEGKSRLEAWFNAQQQAVKLKEPVNLWQKRAYDHKWASRLWGTISAIAGVGGVYATRYVVIEIFGLSKSLIADSKTGVSPKVPVASVNGVRETLHFELILSGALTLFWLTMFFWLMRLLVQRYVSEQRLRVDASGRSAMAETYLGLVGEDAASSTDRPIVLQALFRPVTEDKPGEDGPPITSLAPLVAALVAGKGT